MKIQPFKPSGFQSLAMAAVLVICTAGVATAATGTKRIYDGTPHHCQADVPSGWLSNGIGGWDAPVAGGDEINALGKGLFGSMDKDRNYILMGAGTPNVKVVENDAKRTIVATAHPDEHKTDWQVLVGHGNVTCEAIISFKPPVTAPIKQIALSVKPVH